MVQVFRDVAQDSFRKHGMIGLVGWWCAALLDLTYTVIEQRRTANMSKSTFIPSRWATSISLVLCLPFIVMVVAAAFNLELPFMNALSDRPTALERVVMLGMLFSLPTAFVINFLSMFTKGSTERTPSFSLTRTHTIAGISLLVVLLLTFSQGVSHELKPLVAPLGFAAAFGQILFFLGLLALPVAFLFNRFPVTGFGRLAFQPTSINLIIGAAILLVILMLVSSFALETIACSSGIPNCD